MTDKKKRVTIIGVCGILCVALAVGIATRFGGNAEIPSGKVEDGFAVSSDPNVSIQGNGAAVSDPKPDIETLTPAQNDLAQGADSNGTEQTIQANPDKPSAPDGKPALPDDHKAEDVPEDERKTEDEEPPAYEEKPTAPPASGEPAAGSTNSTGQVYVPGFGYVDHGGENNGGTLDDMYENGNKIGIMGGE